MTSEYHPSQYELSYPDGIERHWWHLARHRVLLDEMRKHLRDGSAVLDVGCGRGIAVRYFRNEGVDCRGVEVGSAKAVPGMADHIHFGLKAVDLPEEERKRCDMILLLDVIEHLPEPATFLRSLASAFGRLSHVVLTVPARSELWSNYDDFFGHHRRYDAAMMEALAHEVEWDLVHQEYFFRLPYLPLRAMAALGMKRQVKMTPPRGVMKPVNRLVSYGMMLEQRVLPRWVPGSSLLATLRIGGR